MNIVKLQINNYRLLKEIEIDLEKDLSLIIGKNNCGKTSVLSVLSKFIGDQSTTNSFNYDDFNIEFQNKLFKYIENSETDWELERIKGIELYIYIEYTDEDNLANLSSLMLDLDPNNKVIVLKLEYTIDKRSILTLVDSFDKYYLRFKKDRKNKLSKRECFENYMHSKSRQYFKIVYKTILFDINKKKLCHEIFRIIEKKKLDLGKIISIKSIAAKRETVNKDNDGTLSNLSSRYYERIKGDEENQVFQEFEDALIDTDVSLTEVYQGLFENVMNKVKKFGGIKENETIVKIISTLRQQQLLKDNTTVVYEAEKHHLPESYNGLGYLNLISIIIQIETILSEFRNDRDKSVSPADINLLFIEEPEAHTHPQMQYVFMKNIKSLLKEGSLGGDGRNKINLQTIITTHSSHIVSECEFDDIKYFQKISGTSVISKNLKNLEADYKDESDPENKRFKFLKQYLTLSYAEIFFADKVILYEGDTERILLPAMMKKIDQEEGNKSVIPLMAQNISLLEAGANSQLFDKFLAFLGIKTLIITDIDSGKKQITKDKKGNDKTVEKACEVKKGTISTNNALKHYYAVPLKAWKRTMLNFFITRKPENKILLNIDGQWIQDKKGKLMVAYQTEEMEGEYEYYPRSFEDAFLFINRDFVLSNIKKFNSLKNIDMIGAKTSDTLQYTYTAYELASECIKTKPSFPMDVLLCSQSNEITDFSNWKIPNYIREGLIWLRED
ncbi:AAA family ATPase [Enterocloster bolteae]|uniref:AAA family ATPase n=1 Tax=Enterocloster bolteae TaxID=208479 RepID=UPI00210CA9C1|nr:ATP-dependent endonuclease [Enterocloster bolteae]MCQ5143924.1 AAA family ATPase [Enterocloster bolteae]